MERSAERVVPVRKVVQKRQPKNVSVREGVSCTLLAIEKTAIRSGIRFSGFLCKTVMGS